MKEKLEVWVPAAVPLLAPVLTMGIYTERKIGVWTCAAMLAAAFAVFYGVWLFVGPELVRSEVLGAAAAAELSLKNPLLVTIHGWATPECMPLMPLTARLLCSFTGVPMESALRGLSIVMLGAGAVMVYMAAGSRHSVGAGVVAAAMYSSCFLALGTAIEGTPATANAFFLGAAQLVFFLYGIRRSDWNRAWIYSALLVTFGFLSGGFIVPVFFIFPMFFFRRPLSVSSKFRRPGFAVAIAIVVLVVLIWWVSFSSSPRQISPYDMWWRQLSEVGLGWRMLSFPFMLAFWLLPWSLIGWIPFCAALQSLDKTPIYSRYLRTLAFSSLALLWLLPETGRYGLFYALVPLSVLTGRFYELGMRRYGVKLRRFLLVVEVFMAVVVFMIAAGCLLPKELLEKFISVDNSLKFREGMRFHILAAVLIALVVMLAYYVHRRRFGDPVWLVLLSASVASALFLNGVNLPYKVQDHSKRAFGTALRQVLPKKRKIYTGNVRNLNGGLFYSGASVYRLGPGENFPDNEKEVYFLSGEFPQFGGYGSWSEVGSFDYNGHLLRLWHGHKNEKKENEDNPGEK